MRAKKRTKRAARRLYQLGVINGLLDEGRVRQIAHRLATSRRRGALSLLSCFQRLVRLDCERRAAVVQSAVPVAAGLREEIEAGIARIYGPGLETTFNEDPALIGGMRIKVGSDVYDGSVRARLAALESRL